MRYWAWFVAKLAVAAVVFLGLLRLIIGRFPAEKSPMAPLSHGLNYLLCDLSLMVWFLMAAGALYLIIWDQRYRCRTCLCRLRMPILIGSWSHILQLGRPRIEYICPYGHGTLREDELQISGRSMPEWEPHSDDLWAELCAAGKDDADRP
jgi:hypothetical protein